MGNNCLLVALTALIVIINHSALGFSPTRSDANPSFLQKWHGLDRSWSDVNKPRHASVSEEYSETNGSRDLDDNEGSNGFNGELFQNPIDGAIKAAERDSLKRSLLKLAAAYDRGYGSTASSRKAVDEIIDRLESLNPTVDASRGISGKGDEVSPLAGIWRMVWTTASDVYTLASSPIATVGSIYQVIVPPIATNIIDFIPRAQALLPPGVAPPTLIRAEVTTRASLREGRPLRIGLEFEAVKLRPIEVLGMATEGFLPPLSFNLPRISVKDIPGVDPENPPGYFDVVYLDDELLVIKQNAPGGLFALVKADNYDP